MSHASEMMKELEYPAYVDRALMVTCLDALGDCVETCGADEEACLAETAVVALRRCTTLDLNCADVCQATLRVLTRAVEFDAEVARAMIGACLVVCRKCGAECRLHGGTYEHCRVCAEACQRCEEACAGLLKSLERAVVA